MTTQSRPDEVAWWFQIGRRSFIRKKFPSIDDPDAYGKQWVEWWKNVQPGWRDVEDWPNQPAGANEKDWGCLPSGGKDGLFIVMVSLGWWILAQAPSKNQLLIDSIDDVTWVVNNLISLLSAACDSPPPSSPLPNHSAPTNAVKIGPPMKRPRPRPRPGPRI